jgi:predicted acyltransferase
MAFDYQKDGQDIVTVIMHMPGRSTNVINGSFLFALAHVLTWWLILFWLYRKKIFIKI